MKRWLRAINPLMKPRGMAEAQWAAQSMVIALALSFLGSLPGAIWMGLNPGWFMAAMPATQPTTDLSAEDIESVKPVLDMLMTVSVAIGVLITAAVYGLLASVQWRRMTRWIPAVWIAFAAYGWTMKLVRQVSGPVEIIQIGPVWMPLLGQACAVAATVIAIASLRGAIMLHRLRREP